METKLARIAQLSRENPDMVFTSIGHLINKEMLKGCHEKMDGAKAVGIDGITKEEYSRKLEENLENLVERLKTKSYKPKLLFFKLKEKPICRLFEHYRELMKIFYHIIREQFCTLLEQKYPHANELRRGILHRFIEMAVPLLLSGKGDFCNAGTHTAVLFLSGNPQG